ncbi:hypothetical protein BAY61_10580 [Prauserella marina]|uniref:Uncharacterized protein n=1 Tax=Prauserella marina TaxID=530584 RepID=A0A222VN75_9PSEU|nr:hypothetical protein [Prauserella marina]ASR35368.1 hypothetical protein BAY61_10580 [Prauserella marina]PWV84836.1 hypothetical protein DES30_101854 [Prauserella marina]SDC11864.1 hypothetical protein SAMN05421630_101482 [Prauserella marina]
MSGKRDFGEFSAKLEKHLERLPDYAQRAQRKLQKYVPPAQRQDGGGQQGQQESTGRDETPRDREASRSARPALPVDLPVVSDMREKWMRWNDPSAKLARQKRRTSRALTLWVVLALLSVLWAVGGYAGVIGAQEGIAGAFGGIAAAVVASALGVRSFVRLRQLNRTELPRNTEPAPLPSAASAARKPMERLAESEASLAELLRQLATTADGAPSAVPGVSVEDAKATAEDAATALRALAARIQAIERARDSAPDGERSALDSAVRTLRTQLDDGVDGYGGLVAAAGKAVAASSGGVAPGKEALTDATDRLAGLALALRELS